MGFFITFIKYGKEIMTKDLLQQKNSAMASRAALLTALLLLGGNLLLPLAVGVDDLVRYYAVAALVLELLFLYLPAMRIAQSLGGPEQAMQKPIPLSQWLWSILFGVGMFFLSTGLNALTMLLWDALGAVPNSAVLPADGGWRLLATMIVVGIIPAFAEESLFRGAFLAAWLPEGKRRALWRVTLLFALIHFQPNALPSLLLLSWLLGALALMTGSCKASMGAHAANNIMGVLIAASAGAAGDTTQQAQLSLGMVLPAAGMYLAIGAVGCLVAWKCLKRGLQAALASAEGNGENGAAEKAQTDCLSQPGAKMPFGGKAALWLTYLILFVVNLAVLGALLFPDTVSALLGG